ncbi:MAG: DUF1343 domain-containing protein [Parachlamydia sp.]|nr:DUF1343 domain-containing protein [Parachlamydia sp.]
MKNHVLKAIICFLLILPLGAEVHVGIDCLFQSQNAAFLKGKRVGLITNHTAINKEGESSVEVFKKQASLQGFKLAALFAPEHGLTGCQYADEKVADANDSSGIPIYSLHGKTRRPTDEMLKTIDWLIYDIQDIGSRSYTYISTLFYAIEEAAKRNIPVCVLDRPNPLNGLTIDGPMLQPKWRSFVGYINTPYCHGMTVGELARYFNAEYKTGCQLHVIPMEGWERWMSFEDTKLPWIPTSPHIPESDTTFYYPTTGLLGELQLVNIGVGYTLPFKVIGAPWIDAASFAKRLNEQNYPGVHFHPFHYRPFFGRFAKEDCQGVLVQITDKKDYLPVTIQFLIIGMLKALYPREFDSALQKASHRIDMFNKVNGTDEVYRLLKEEKYVIWKLKILDQEQRDAFRTKRATHLIY